MFYKTIKQEAKAQLDTQIRRHDISLQHAHSAAVALDAARRRATGELIPAVDAWLERFASHKSVFELEAVMAQLRDIEPPALASQGSLGAVHAQALMAVAGGGAAAGGGAVALGAGAQGAAAVGTAALLPVGLMVAGGVLVAGGLFLAVRRRARRRAERFAAQVQQEAQETLVSREALEAFTTRAQGQTTALGQLHGRIESLLDELSEVSHLYVQYWTYRQRQALTDLLECAQMLQEVLSDEIAVPEAAA